MPIRKTYRSVRCTLVREPATEPYRQRRAIRSGRDVADLIRTTIADEPRECFVAILLDSKNQVIGLREVSVGVADSALVHPREVFTAAVGLAATSIIVAHNHPSGNPSPSHQDRQVTDRLREAGELLGIHLLDHLIIGDRSFYSFTDGVTATY